ncbi:MAG: mechanosensitive ion channel family protein [Endomicrobiia bacterium]
MLELFNKTNLLFTIYFFVGGIVVGIILEKIVLTKLKSWANKTSWAGDDIIIDSLRGITFVLCVVFSIYLLLNFLKLDIKLFGLLNKILFVSVVFSISIAAMKMAIGFINLYAKQSSGVLFSTSIFTNLTKVVIWAMGGLIILQTMGISITPVLTALGVGGLAVALALQPTLTNLFSGLHIILSRQIRTGDYIKLNSGEEGFVVDITWKNTTIRALPNNLIIIPNSTLASAIIINYDLPETEMSVIVQVGVSYASDLEKVEKVTIEVAREVLKTVTGGVSTFEPFIRYHTFSDFSINFSVILRAKQFVDQYLIKHEFIKKLHQRYKQENIEIPFPIRTVYTKPCPEEK